MEPPTEAEMDREFQRVGPFLYVPLELPADEIPEALEDQ